MTTSRRRTTLVPGPVGDLEVLTTGHGDPSSVFAHGLASSIDGTRPYATSVPGRRTFLHLRGHGRSTAPTSLAGWSYDALARDVAAVADSVGATRAFGVSMGAGAICALVASSHSRFERIVLALPASIEAPVDRDAQLAAILSTWEADDSARMQATPGVRAALQCVPQEAPLRDRAALALVTAQVLVIGQEGDSAHPAQVARDLADCFANGRSVILPPGGILQRHRSQVRHLVRDALS